jgi:leucyl aminopeptidase
MIEITLVSNNLIERACDAYVFFCRNDFDFARLSGTAGQLYAPYEQAVKDRGFTGKSGSSLIVNGIYKEKAVYLIFLGLGDLPHKKPGGSIEAYRRALGKLVRIAESHRISSFTFDLPDPAVLDLSYHHLAEETSTFLHKASYHFDQFITNKERTFQWSIHSSIGVPDKYITEAKQGLDRGICFAEAINLARTWCDMPPSHLPPLTLAHDAVNRAKEYGLVSTILDKKEIEKLGMGGIEGVCRGSVNEPCMVIIEYKTAKKDAPTIALVGKGVTFDTGGLCIKPAASMLTMKDDMAGAAVVLATMNVIAQLKPDVNVVALAPLVENMPSGSAIKPGDVLKTYNGKTIEVIDTDAEGRLILADALAYAADKYKPIVMIDLATLTGAMGVALGVFYAGLFTQDDELSERVIASSISTGDQVWRMPLDDDYIPAIISDIADVKNVGDRRYLGSSITAALFLKEFVGDTPWAHLDIASVAFGVPDLSYLRPGATGFGIRLLTDFVMRWKPADEKSV